MQLLAFCKIKSSNKLPPLTLSSGYLMFLHSALTPDTGASGCRKAQNLHLDYKNVSKAIPLRHPPDRGLSHSINTRDHPPVRQNLHVLFVFYTRCLLKRKTSLRLYSLLLYIVEDLYRRQKRRPGSAQLFSVQLSTSLCTEERWSWRICVDYRAVNQSSDCQRQIFTLSD